MYYLKYKLHTTLPKVAHNGIYISYVRALTMPLTLCSALNALPASALPVTTAHDEL